MTDDRLTDAREDARGAIERYDGLDRSQRMDDRVLKERAVEMRDALESLVDATGKHLDVHAHRSLREKQESAQRALEEFQDPTEYDHAQHVRRACYVLRKEAKSLLGELDEVNS